MTRFALAAATFLTLTGVTLTGVTLTGVTLTGGAALAQTITETTTTYVPVPAPAPPVSVSQSTTQHTVDGDGVVTDHSKTVTTGTAVSPYGETTTTRRTVESTTTR